MSKFLVNLLLQISKALVNSKIQFLFGNSFPCFRPGRPHGPFGLWPSQPTGRAVPAGQNRLGRAIQPARRSRLCGKYVFPFGSRLPEPTASPLFLSQQGPTCQIHPLPPRRPTPVRNPPRRRSPAPLPRASDAPELLQPSLITLPP
jgi:hypothetical protein